MKESLWLLTFLYFMHGWLIGQNNEILINEIYADPTPSNGLPNAEYVELFNANPSEIYQLSDFYFRNSSKTFVLPDISIDPLGYIILCHTDAVETMSDYGDAIGIKSFSALVNTGDELALETRNGILIHSVSYSRNWYKNEKKEDGGWSLELIDPLQPCLVEENWIATENVIGGTPGKENSVYHPGLFQSEFEITSIVPVGVDQLKIQFNQRTFNMPQISDFELFGGLAQVSNLQFTDGNFNQINLEITPPLEKGTVYNLTILLQNCRNEPLSKNQMEIRIPEDVEEGDLLINEILFNPKPGGVDYLEIYNASNKEISTQGLFIGNISSGGLNDSEALLINHIIQPNEFIVCTPNPTAVSEQYFVKTPALLFKNILPNFGDEEGNVTLYRTDPAAGKELIIDAFDYNEDFHAKLIKDPEGISLERIRFDQSTNQASNWHSASKPSGFGTPTALNSQHMHDKLGGSEFELSPRTFSPDGDGRDDFLFINYSFEQPGFIGNIKIFDAAGRMVKYLWNNVPLSASGFLKWDGDTDSNEKAPIGIYIVWIQAFHPDGQVQKWKDTCVLAGNLD